MAQKFPTYSSIPRWEYLISGGGRRIRTGPVRLQNKVRSAVHAKIVNNLQGVRALRCTYPKDWLLFAKILPP